MAIAECPECKQLFGAEEKGQKYCSRRCARLAQARHGVPSWEDRKLQFVSAMLEKFDELFKPK